MKTRHFATALAVPLLALGAGNAVQAASVTLCGPNICYVYEDTQAGIAYFGAPTLVGDDLRFLPTTFMAMASIANPTVDIRTATFVIDQIYASGGQALATVGVTEIGDHRVRGSGEASADLFLLVSSNASSESAIATAGVEQIGDSAGFQNWSIAAAVDATTAFSQLTYNVALTLQDNLVAVAAGGDALYAFIQKKGVTVSVAAVPLPATAWLLLPGIAMLGRRALRKARAA